jgi:hypothetical protein
LKIQIETRRKCHFYALNQIFTGQSGLNVGTLLKSTKLS